MLTPMQNLQPMECREPRFRALIPFFVFIAFYLGLSIWAHDFYKVPMPTAFLVASAAALAMDHKRPLGEKVEIYARGMGEPNIMIMCLIFILAGAFASTAKGMGAVDGAVVIARALVPDSLMLLGMFLVSSFISLAVGTSCGTIAALTPIAAGLSGGLSIPPAMLLGAIIGGAMFGDNLSMISDTTIAATRTQNVPMKDKFRQNFLLVLPAVLATSAIYLFCGGAVQSGETPPVTWAHCFAVLPYILILVFALFGWNVMLLLFAGTVLAGITGIVNGSFDFWGMLDMIGQGTLGMSETLIVAILAGGLLQTIRRNGGIGYLMELIQKRVRSKRGCEFGVLILVALVNLFTANNTVAIVIAGPLARELSDRYQCSARRIASILDAGSCVVQGMIPYGAQILIAVGVAQTSNLDVSSLSLVRSLFYPMLLGICLVVAIAIHSEKRESAPAKRN